MANADAVVSFPYRRARPGSTGPASRSSTCPARPSITTGPRTWWRAPTARRLYATVGSNSNVADNGIDAEEGRAAISKSNRAAASGAYLASGLRNPNGLAFEPHTGALWTVVNERDEIGDDLAPDYLTSVKDGGFYGWPYSYWGRARRHAGAAPTARPVARRSPPTMRWARTRPRSASPSTRRAPSPRRTAAAPSSASTAPGIAAAQRLQGRLRPVARTAAEGCRRRSSPASSTPRTKSRAVRSASLDDQGALLVADDVGDIVWRVAPAARWRRGDRRVTSKRCPRAAGFLAPCIVNSARDGRFLGKLPLLSIKIPISPVHRRQTCPMQPPARPLPRRHRRGHR